MKIWMALAAACLAWGAAPQQVEVFTAGEGGYHTYRIPALITSSKGTLLAFCEGRRNSASDTGNIDLLLRRSNDGGRTWQPLQTIADFGEDTIGNPAPVVERKTGAIILLLTSNPGRATEKGITERATQERRTVWITRSTDDGQTWSKPQDITASTKLPDWTWYATGPGNGIQTRSGRLVIPCDHNTAGANVRYSHVIYSDDRGQTWKIGGTAEEKTNESAVAELKDSSLLLNMRSYHGKNRRAVQRSRDGGLTWQSPLTLDETLIEPVCQASLVAAVPPGKKSNGRLLFSNPAATTRTKMTVRLSEDDGRTWASSRVIHEGPAAYSSLAVLPGRSIGLLYERGESRPYERITFARFGLDWVKGK
jgi:sialidase-1